MQQAIDLLLEERDKLDRAILILRGPIHEIDLNPIDVAVFDKYQGKVNRILDAPLVSKWTAARRAAQSAAQKARWAKLRKAAKKAA